ncbi:hypothetical protein L228DRAFT_243152 [Xylona heveae TC161]|uniref:Translation initiation factor 3 N-terminal domain-containing protein n=1 Tax=Xylona heveae (strain CBS 132557 / TC161) TaxID=1328760 RepID=A0A165JUN9_XYLHT|nr:hypothetical protein L228DRAFT_243152 [Xylona heveae TC161]KZF26653.1 hypothetical protein L228DRAFT_243152 [Xylona heveae TC161]
MGRIQHLCGTVRALHQVFVKFEPSPPAFQALRAPPLAPFPRRFPSFALPQTRLYFKKSTKQIPAKKRAAWDEEIEARTVRIVNEEGGLDEPVPLRDILDSIDRTIYRLVQLTKLEPNTPAICKIISKRELLEASKAKAKPPKNPQASAKKLELNWAIAPNDLSHRLRKLEEFLEAGRRVEVLLAPKKKSRMATAAEAETTLKRIREAVDSVNGAKEWKPMEGQLLRTATLHFEGLKDK